MGNFAKTLKRLLKGRVSEHSPDIWLIVAVFAIVVFGLVMLSSASSVVAYSKFKNSYYYFNHQLFGLVLGLIGFWLFSRIDYHIWHKYAFWFLLASIGLLLLVFIPGLSAHYGKARSWINVFGYSLQPSEFVKLSFLLYLSAWLDRRGKSLHDVSEGFGPFIAIMGAISILMLLQPDFGTLFIISLTSLAVYFVGGGSKKHIATILVAGALGFTAMVNLRPYQMNRIKCMLDPEFSRNDICYQVNQSLIAVGSGGFLGRGIGESRQKFSYLPEVSSDSIFAIIGEEMGLLVSSLLVMLYLTVFYRGVRIGRFAPDGNGRILAIGISTWIVLQAYVNIGGIINLMPMTGVPLPLVSYGGSSMLAALSGLGILVNISKQTTMR